MFVTGSSGPKKLLIGVTNEGVSVTGDTSVFLGYKVPFNGKDAGTWVNWQCQGGRVKVTNDRFGFYPVFYFHTKTRFGISTSILDLLAYGAAPELNDAAIAVFLRLGFFLAHDTPFDAIHALPPDCTLVWDKGVFDILQNNHPAASSTSNRISQASAIVALGECVDSAVKRLVPTQKCSIGLPLSGGRDSRHILFALLNGLRQPDVCLTTEHFPPKPNEDARIAASLCSHLNIPHVTLKQTVARLQAELRKNLLTNFCAREHEWMITLADYANRSGFHVLYDGIGGDVLSAGLYLTEQRHRLYNEDRISELAENILGSEGYLPRLLNLACYRRWNRASAIARLHSELKKYTETPNPIAQFYFWNRTRRSVALGAWSILQGRCCVLAPFLDHEVYDLLSGLPATYFLDHTFHTKAIETQYPQFAHLPFETKTDPPTPQLWVNNARYALGGLRYHLSRKPAVNRLQFMLPRLVKALLSKEYGTELPSICRTGVHLAQLYEVTRDAVASDTKSL